MRKFFANKNDYFLATIAIILSLLLVVGLSKSVLITYVALVSLAVLVVLANNFKISLVLILFSLVASQILRIPITGYGGSLLVSDLIILLIDVIWLAKKLIFNEGLAKTSINIFLLLFIAITAISTIYSLNFLIASEVLAGAMYFVRWIAYLMVFFIVLDFIKTKENVEQLTSWMIYSGIAVAIAGFIQLIFVPSFAFMQRLGWDPHVGRLLSTFFDPNLVGVFFNLVFAVIINLLIVAKSKKDQLFLSLSGLIILAAIVLTYSRSAYLGLVVVIIITALLKSWKLLVASLIILAVIFVSIPRSVQRIQGAFAVDQTSQARIISWQEGFKIIGDHPLLGIGFNNLPYVKVDDAGSGLKIIHSASGLDSSVLTIWATTGIIGLILYLAVYAKIIWQGFKNYVRIKSFDAKIGALSAGIACGLVAIFFETQFVNGLLFPSIMIAIWYLAALVFAYNKKTARV